MSADLFTATALACLASPAFLITAGAIGLVLGVLGALLMNAWAVRPHDDQDAGDTHARDSVFECEVAPRQSRRVRAGQPLRPSYDGRHHANPFPTHQGEHHHDH